MHELGVVFHIMDDVEEIAKKNSVTGIKSVTLELGEVSTVIPHFLSDCWNWAVNKNELMRGAKLNIEMIPAVTYCEDCSQTYDTVPQGKRCPHCGSFNTWLVQGNEFILKEIEVIDSGPE